MLHGKPRPCIIQFNKLLPATVRTRHYENVLSLSIQTEFVDAMCKSGNLKDERELLSQILFVKGLERDVHLYIHNNE